ncbi:nucleotidyltransferase substrate binding protein [Acetobacter fabarum]|uniref:nucleotidyltransferase substrate binding protein n=1 Tax=Acetobacter fabarum TaxID=483199 RepID=UPI0033A60B13
MLYLTPLERALDRLKEGWVRHLAQPDDEQLRDGLIQRFEFTYELSHKTLKRFLEVNSASPEDYDRMGFPDMIRSANEAGLLKSAWPQWSVFRKMRNLTSHTYNEMTAKQVVATIPDFIAETEFLLATLKERTA